MIDDDARLKEETLDQLFGLAPRASRGWWGGADDDQGCAPGILLVRQLIDEGLLTATFGAEGWIVSAQLTPRGRHDVEVRRAAALLP
jgi:hypothetical protein